MANCSRVAVDKKAYAEILDLLRNDQFEIEDKILDTRNFYNKYNRPEKFKYSMLLQVYSESISYLNRYTDRREELINNSDSLILLYQDLTDHFLNTKRSIHAAIDSNPNAFGLSLSQADKIHEEIKIIKLNKSKLDVKDDYLNFVILEYEFFKKYGELQILSGALMGRIYDEYWAFPVVASEQCGYKIGEKVDIDISIGSNSSSYEPSDVKIIANSDTVELMRDGVAHYSSLADKVGKNIIEIEFQIINRHTGELVNGYSQYRYEVYK